MEEIRPDVGVMRRVGQLEHAEIERRTKVEADEVVGTRLVNQLDLVRGPERADERGRVVEPIRHMCYGTKPRQPHN